MSFAAFLLSTSVESPVTRFREGGGRSPLQKLDQSGPPDNITHLKGKRKLKV